ncbi:hypothetical protein EHQ58_13815 [Leptospira ognonensis]|uniref:Uncharacterized protein n=1 Tax=Leptospira ognonensis TaxID=2484945 RepID=A0A4R9JYS7_9LEPT|nr:hypothetical protein [Leptospira ognonensis]TGL57365.1 hypothetical protein EHQ58_13815 [Leptospira ognonensis]
MRTNPPTDSFLQITSKELLSRSAGIILQKEGLTIMKAIEAQSRKSNFDSGSLFQATEASFDKLKIATELAYDQLWELIDFGIVTQMFEIRLNKTSEAMELVPYVVSIPEDLPSLEDAFHRLLNRSVSQIKNYVLEKKSLTEDLWRLILVKISDPEYIKNFSEGDDLFHWTDTKKFPFSPSKAMLVEARELILDGLSRETQLLVIPKIGFYSLVNSQISNLLVIAYELFIAKIEPLVRNFDLGLQDRLEEIGREDAENLIAGPLDEILQIKTRINLYLAYEPMLREKGYFQYISIMNQLCGLAEKEVEAARKVDLEKLLRGYLTMLESTLDFDSSFLRLNIEREDRNEIEVIDLLRKNRDVLSAVWHDEDNKVAIFALKNIQKLIEINNQIYNHYRFTTKFILYFKALIEFNEPDIKAIFKDEDFLKTYGKNLEAVYFHYIPWYYRIFYYLNIDPITNIGYSKAKSIISYGQMEREIKYKARRENYFKRKLREKQERIEKEKRVQHKRILIQAIEEAFFTKNTIPTLEWILGNYPIFSPQLIEKIIQDFAFLKYPNKGISDDTILLFPNSPEFGKRYKRLMDETNARLREDSETNEPIKAKLIEIRSFLSNVKLVES